MGPIKNDRVLKVHVVICVSDRGVSRSAAGGRCFEIVVATARLPPKQAKPRTMKLHCPCSSYSDLVI
jgi:hypothetical protein